METNKNEQVSEMRLDSKMLTGLFTNNMNAEKGYDFLIEKGYDSKEISMVMSEATKKNYFTNTSQGTKIESDSIISTEKGAVIGSSIGLTMGAIVGITLAIGSNVVIPGLGFLVAGPLLAGLAGAGTGSIAGGLIGALMGVGFGEDRAQLYEDGLKNGQILIGIHPKIGDEGAIKLAWESMGAKEVDM